MVTWFDILPDDVVSLGEKLAARAADERDKGKVLYPAQENIFRALELTPPERLSICCCGQDPYFNPLQANGLAFSVNDGVRFPPSLRNIFNELVDDVGCTYPESGNLAKWAERGVLLLNTSLTVEEGTPNSHVGWGWNVFTKGVFQAALELPQPVVFLLWGKNAQGFLADVDFKEYHNKKALVSTHPSPLSAKRACGEVPAFVGSKPFSRANALLTEMGGQPVEWRLI